MEKNGGLLEGILGECWTRLVERILGKYMGGLVEEKLGECKTRLQQRGYCENVGELVIQFGRMLNYC